MIEAIQPSAARFLADLTRIHERAARAERQISSGLKLTSPSDDPGHVQDLLVTRTHLEQVVQTRMNLDRATAEADTAEQALAGAMKSLDSVAQTGVEGANSLKSTQSRLTLATVVQAILEQLVATSRTSAEGRFLFSGDSDQVAPYALDLNQPNGVTAYAGSDATRLMMHPAGTRFAMSHTAQEIFDNPAAGKNIFAAVNALRLALQNGPAVPPEDPAYEAQHTAQTQAISDALQQVRSARDHLSTELAYAGVVQNRVAEAVQFATKLELRQRTALSNLQDADLAAAALELSQASTHQEAALQARAILPKSSLFDYLA
jgi:flagellar hook-associated protein 3 FlgL